MWEWDNKAMMEAINLHDRVMRMHMAKYGGYEVATEGDAFLIAFHTPGNAVAYATATQQVSCLRPGGGGGENRVEPCGPRRGV